MEKEKKIIYKFLAFILVGLSIVIYGITHKVIPNVLAETINVGYVTDKTTILYENNNAQAMVSLPVNNTLNQYLYNILVIQLNNQTITKDYTYMLELYLPEGKLKNINNVYVVGGNNNGTTCQTIGLDNSNTSYPKIYFKCPVNLSSLTIGLNNDSPVTSTESITTSSNFRWSYSYLRYYTEDDDIDLSPIIGNATANTNNIINNNNNNTQNIINNNDENTQKIIDSNKENFQTCRDSLNLFDSSTIVMGDTINANSSIRASSRQSLYLETGTYTFKTNLNLSTYGIALAIASTAPPLSDYNYIRDIGYLSRQEYTFTLDTPGYFMVTIRKNGNLTFTLNEINNNEYMLVKGSTISTYEKYGEEICTNKLDEQNKTSKGILGKIGDLISYINPASENFFVYKLIELLGNLLKDLFVPSQSYLSNWYNDFKNWIELKLGFLATPITLFLDFIELYLNLDEGQLVINIPEIKVPNFEEQVLIQARTFDWGELLNSKTEFKNLWELYLDFIDVFLILNFLGLCENTYNRIFGGDTTQYEYYTTEETYNINDETGEATNHQLRQRRTRRERV